jgi:hypothetical protein
MVKRNITKRQRFRWNVCNDKGLRLQFVASTFNGMNHLIMSIHRLQDAGTTPRVFRFRVIYWFVVIATAGFRFSSRGYRLATALVSAVANTDLRHENVEQDRRRHKPASKQVLKVVAKSPHIYILGQCFIHKKSPGIHVKFSSNGKA